MTKVFTLTITTSGFDSEAKEEELITKIEERIADIRATLGGVQLDLTIVEQE